jgi:hypothetical protein
VCICVSKWSSGTLTVLTRCGLWVDCWCWHRSGGWWRAWAPRHLEGHTHTHTHTHTQRERKRVIINSQAVHHYISRHTEVRQFRTVDQLNSVFRTWTNMAAVLTQDWVYILYTVYFHTERQLGWPQTQTDRLTDRDSQAGTHRLSHTGTHGLNRKINSQTRTLRNTHSCTLEVFCSPRASCLSGFNQTNWGRPRLCHEDWVNSGSQTRTVCFPLVSAI